MSRLFRSFWPQHYLEAHLKINHDGLSGRVISLFNVIARYWPVIADCSYVWWFKFAINRCCVWHETNIKISAMVSLHHHSLEFCYLGRTQDFWIQVPQQIPSWANTGGSMRPRLATCFLWNGFLTWSDMVLSWNKRWMIDWADDNKARNMCTVVRFPNPLAPDIQIHVSWGTRLVFCVESSEEH